MSGSPWVLSVLEIPGASCGPHVQCVCLGEGGGISRSNLVVRTGDLGGKDVPSML